MKTALKILLAGGVIAALPSLAFAQANSAPFQPSNAIPGVMNFDPALLPYARAAMAKVRSGSGRMKIAFIGDSTTVGQGGGTGGTNNVNGAKNASFPAIVAKTLNAQGVPATSDSFFGTGGTFGGSSGPTSDTRVTYGTGWASGPDATLGGSMITQSTTTSSSYAITPTLSINNCDVYYFNGGTSPTFTVDYDGTNAVSVSPTAGATLAKQSITPPLGIHTINIIRTSASGTVYILGVDCYNTTTPEVSTWNFGVTGVQSSYFNVNSPPAWEPLAPLGYYAPDLTIIDIGINDESVPVSYATFYANVQAVITEAKISGDVILVMHHDCNGHATSELVTLAAFQALASANNLPFANFMYRLGSWTQAQALGEMYDQVHGSNVGYADEANMLVDLLKRL